MDLFEQRRLLVDSVKYSYFKSIERALEYYSKRREEEKRQKMIELYNKLGSIVYHIKTTPIDDEFQTMRALRTLQRQIKMVLSQFKLAVGDDVYRFSDDKMTYQDVL